VKLRLALVLGTAALVVAGCGGSGGGSGISSITVAAAHTYKIVGFEPSGPVEPGKPVKVSFQIQQPDGTVMKAFKTGAGPHTGVHIIFVRDDLAYIIHHHPPLNGTGNITDTVTFPAPGPYRLVLDVYPAGPSQGSANTAPPLPGVTPTYNFQLFGDVKATGDYTPQPLPPPDASEVVDGYHFTIRGASHVKAIQAQIVHVTVTDPNGKPAAFMPWYGALAHAIFFHGTTLDYFHTHVCAPGATGCTSILGTSKIVGTSTEPGKLSVGVLLPLPGTWRLFLQCQVNGHVLTAPFTLKVS
jgi:hypothetical protein